MILVTGATGGYGKSAIKALLNKGVKPKNITALVRDEAKASDLKDKGITIKVADYSNYDSLVSAFENIDQLLFVSGSDVLNREAQHKNILKAAVESKIDRVVYTSFIRNTVVENSAIAYLQDTHYKTEQWIKDSDLNYTILQNATYLENLPLFLGDNILDNGVISLPAGSGKSNCVLKEELAEAAAHILVSEDHKNKTYPLTNTESHSYKDVAEILTEISGKEIVYQSPSAEDYEKTLKEYGVPEEYISLLTTFSVAQANGELELYDNHLEDFLGRKPTTLKEYLTKVYA